MTSAASTANAAVPAPGKLEFKDDYTPEEAERVIRNSKGLPVGVKPKMVWTWPKALLWAVIAIVCAIGWAILAVSRGEQISAIWFVVVALCSYAIAYRFYAYYIQIKIMRTDDANATPAERVHDGANFERADRRVLFGQHFAGISGAGPLVGPILAAQMGYLPSADVDHSRCDFRRRRAGYAHAVDLRQASRPFLRSRWQPTKWASSAALSCRSS